MSDSRSARSVDGDRANAIRYTALAVGIVFLVIGIAGFFVTGFDEFAERTGETLLGFEVNPLHNLVHLAFGVAGVVMWRSLSSARTYGWVLVVAYGVVLIYGLFVAGRDEGNILSINTADNVLHLIFVLVGLFLAFFPAGDRRAATR